MTTPAHDVLFLGTFVPPWLNDEIGDEIARRRLRGRMVEPERRHISLVGIATPGGNVADEIVCAMAALAPDLRPFRVSFDLLVINPGQSLLIANEGLPAVDRHRQRLRTAFAERGVRLGKARLPQPHVTLGYKGGVDGGVRPAGPISWDVRDLALILSHQGRHRYTILQRWPLAPSPAG